MSGSNRGGEKLLFEGQDLREGKNRPLTPEQEKILGEIMQGNCRNLHALGLSEAQLAVVLLGYKNCPIDCKKALAEALDFEIFSYLTGEDFVSFQETLKYVPSETMEKLLQENSSFFLQLPFDKKVFISFKYGEELLSLDQVLTQEAIQAASQEEVVSLFRENVLYNLSGSEYYENNQGLGLLLCQKFGAENMIALMNANCKFAEDKNKYDSPFTFYFDLFVNAIKGKIFTENHLRQLITSDLNKSCKHQEQIIEGLREHLDFKWLYTDNLIEPFLHDSNILRFYRSVVPLCMQLCASSEHKPDQE